MMTSRYRVFKKLILNDQALVRVAKKENSG